MTNLYKLSWQHQYAGLQLINQRILVCDTCLDVPQRQLGSIILPPDPMPVMNARPENYPIDELWPVMLEGGNQQGGMPLYLETSATANDTDNAVTASLETSTISATTP